MMSAHETGSSSAAPTVLVMKEEQEDDAPVEEGEIEDEGSGDESDAKIPDEAVERIPDEAVERIPDEAVERNPDEAVERMEPDAKIPDEAVERIPDEAVERMKAEEKTFCVDRRPELGYCEMCTDRPALYKCPRCEMKTCSLVCVKSHKQKFDCNGLRDRTKYVPLKKFSNLDLLSDHQLLEEARRVIENLDESVVYESGSRWEVRRGSKLSKETQALVTVAKKQNIRLHFLPPTFSKHRTNSTVYCKTEKAILWHVEWRFYVRSNSESESLKFVDEKVSENQWIAEALEKYMEPSVTASYPSLRLFQQGGYNGIAVLLETEGREKRGRTFYDLELQCPIRNALSGKDLVEHPTFHVILKRDLCPERFPRLGIDVKKLTEDRRRKKKRRRGGIEAVECSLPFGLAGFKESVLNGSHHREQDEQRRRGGRGRGNFRGRRGRDFDRPSFGGRRGGGGGGSFFEAAKTTTDLSDDIREFQRERQKAKNGSAEEKIRIDGDVPSSSVPVVVDVKSEALSPVEKKEPPPEFSSGGLAALSSAYGDSESSEEEEEVTVQKKKARLANPFAVVV